MVFIPVDRSLNALLRPMNLSRVNHRAHLRVILGVEPKRATGITIYTPVFGRVMLKISVANMSRLVTEDRVYRSASSLRTTAIPRKERVEQTLANARISIRLCTVIVPANVPYSESSTTTIVNIASESVCKQRYTLWLNAVIRTARNRCEVPERAIFANRVRDTQHWSD